MKKLIVLFLFVSLAFAGSAQIFKPVASFSTKAENNYKVSIGEIPITQKWEWRFDATQAFAEINRNTVTKELITTAVSFIGPAIGYQHFVQKSLLDPTPVNNYGISMGVALGETIYNPELAKLKFTLAGNLWQYFKVGGTFTPNPLPDMGKWGFFFGGGITF
ncbi:MAG: hypothetical protein JJE45_00030 [Prolixibacteraceae bacterium]|nr:hypothetical protein [Prolixibacteraceae bacterium]